MIDWLCTKERAIIHATERARELADGDDRAVVVAVLRIDGAVEDELVVDAQRVA